MELVALLLVIFVVADVIALLVVAWLWYMGMFSKIYIQLKEVPEMTIINMNYTGAMKDTFRGYKDFERKVTELLGSLPTFPVMGGAYYTTPSQVKIPEDNRWSCFFVLDDVPELLKKAKALPKSDEYSVITIPKSRAIYGSFVYRNSLSYTFGPMKVYPAITKFMNETQIKPVGCIELYHFSSEPVEYMMYIDNEEIFKQLEKTSFVAANLLD